MAETPSQSPTPASTDTTWHYWCHNCSKRVSIETLANQSEVVCVECKNGFVEIVLATATPLSDTPSLSSDHADDSNFGSQLLQMLRMIAQAAHDEDSPPLPPPLPQDPQSEDDYLRIELNGWGNVDEDDDGNANENEVNRDGERDEEEDRSGHENEESREEGDVEELRRRRLDILRLLIRDFTRSGRNRILDWAEILMGLEDNSIEFRLEVPETDRYIGNPEDYVDAAGYEALLQNLADSDGGRRGSPPASISAISALPTVAIKSEEQVGECAICKDKVTIGDTETMLPCGHGYHGHCILPWLGSRNSCPVCRFELPTDDADYEAERKMKAVAAVGGVSGSGDDNLDSN